MVSLQATMCALVLAAGAGDTVLLDFSADWCGPCRQMEPVVRQLAAAGYPVRQVNVDREPQLAAQFQASSIPCFVLLVGGREVDRVVGGTTYARLEQMFQKAQGEPASPARPAGGPLVKISTNKSGDLEKRLLAASVRLRIDDQGGHSVGSGTIIDARAGEALILTCGHVFRDSQGRGKIVVDLFGRDAPQGLPARLVNYDLKNDVGLISIRPGVPVATAPLAEQQYQPQRGEPVFSVGCNHGGDPSLLRTRVTSINKFQGPANLQIDGQPVQGRSGGGLFTSDGRVIGVCNAADPADNEGLFAALPTVYGELSRLGLLEVIGATVPPPPMPARMPPVDTTGWQSVRTGTTDAHR